MALEIERKFLVKNTPVDLKEHSISREIVQGYISSPRDSKTIRLRKVDGLYFLTVKMRTDRPLEKEELEPRITKSQFTALWPAVGSRVIRKTRYLAPFHTFLLEVDFYHESLEGLITVEVEFISLKEANSFTPPEWFGKEVSKDSRFSNQHLATFGLPKMT